MPTTPGNAVSVFEESAYPVLFDTDGQGGGLAEVLADNFGDEGFSASDLDRVVIPAAGGRFWDIPDEDATGEIEGVMIHRQQTRSFWFKKRGEDGEEDGPPDCYSNDGKVGIGTFGKGSEANPDGACADCPMNVYGSSTSGAGTGKACKEQMQVYMLQPGSVLPLQISLPPTSLKPFRKYMTRLTSKGKSYFAVVTRFGLEQTKGGGNTYSVIVPSRVADLDPEQARAARGYGETIKGQLETAQADRIAAERAAADDAAASEAAGKPATS